MKTTTAASLKRGQTILTQDGPWEVEGVRVRAGYGVVSVYLKGDGDRRREETLPCLREVKVKNDD